MPEERPYLVRVNENSHFMDESESYDQDRYDDCASAIAVCKAIVDEFFDKTAAELAK